MLGSNAIPVVASAGRIPRKYPKAEVFGSYVRTGNRLSGWYELVKAGMPERIGAGNLRSLMLIQKHTPIISYYTQYGR
jgi:hypothetical protein